jgi:hypothetical protein
MTALRPSLDEPLAIDPTGNRSPTMCAPAI